MKFEGPPQLQQESIESARTEKEAKLQTTRQEVDSWGDRLGEGVDEGIKETVVVCNAMGLSTSESCEGHFKNESDHGFPAPWIEVEAPNKPQWRFEREAEIYDQVAKKYGVTVDQVMHADNDEAWKEAVRLSAEQEETAEYKAWKKENERLFRKAESLLQEFYRERSVPDELRIIANRGAGGFRLHNGGKFYIPNNQKERLQNELTEEERNRIPEVLRGSQEEMRTFAEFLKEKYFGESSEAKFMQPPTEKKNKQLGGKEDERRNLFERVYKSRTARILALAAALGIGGKFLLEKQEEYHAPSTQHELVEKNRLELGELEKKFSTKVEISNTENRYILHIAQMHGAHGLEESRRGMEMAGKDLGYLVEKQKDIERLLTLLSEKYQVKDVFVEGVDKTVISLIEQIKSDIVQNQDGTLKSPPERWNTAASIFSFAKNSQEGVTEAQRAYLLSLAQSTIKKELGVLSQSYEHYQAKTGDVQQEYAGLFRSWEQRGVSFRDIVTGLSEQEREMSNHELLKNDVVYVWGGTMKLYLEGRINIHPAETMEANQEAFAKYPGGAITFTQEQLKDPKELERLRKMIEVRRAIDERGHNIREDAAVNLIAQSPNFQSRQFSPLVYGEGHDFKNNIEKFNKRSWHGVGLIRIEPRK